MGLTKSERASLGERFGGKCAYCGHDLGARWHADHVEPVVRKTKFVRDDSNRAIIVNGRYKMKQDGFWNPQNDRKDNYLPACVPCNIDKTCLDLEEWRKSIADKFNVALRASTPLRHAKRFGLITVIEKPVVFYFETFGSIVRPPDIQ